MTRSRPFALGAVAVFVVAACTPSATAGAPGSTAPATASVPGASLPTQTETDWGRIWDASPPRFPQPSGAQITTATDAGPTSAELAIDSGTREEAADFYLGALRDAGYIVGSDGPLEDGSIVVSASDGYGCAIQVTVRRAGSLLLARVLYGAGCPFEAH